MNNQMETNHIGSGPQDGKGAVWYRAMYNLAVTYKHLALCLENEKNCPKGKVEWAGDGEVPTQKSALDQAKETAQTLVYWILVSPKESEIYPFLNLLEPMALILLASILTPDLDSVPSRTEQRPEVNREELLRLLEKRQLTNSYIIDFIESDYRTRLPNRARYNLACYFTRLAEVEKERKEKHLDRALIELKSALEPGDLADYAQRDVSLQFLSRERRSEFKKLVSGKSGESNGAGSSSGSEIGLLPGITKQDLARLAEMNIRTAEAFEESTDSQPERQKVAVKLNIPIGVVRRWRGISQLLVLNDLGPKTAKLLSLAGIESPRELADPTPGDVVVAMRRANAAEKLLKDVPTESDVKAWVAQAESLGFVG
jgi:hypothetical protein